MGPGRDGWKGCHEKKRKGADTIPHILRKDHPARRERTTKRGREKDWLERRRARARRKESSIRIRHNSFPRYSPVSGANTPTPLPLPNLPNESALRPTSSILPAARYRLPNNLTDCSAPATSGIRVLVSFQNLSEYPEILI